MLRDTAQMMVGFLIVVVISLMVGGYITSKEAQQPAWAELAEQLPQLQHQRTTGLELAQTSNWRPSERLQTIIERMDLTDEARAVLVNTQPAVVSDLECGGITAVGCFAMRTNGQTSITFLASLDNADLVVVVSHELMHAVWHDLLTISQREKLKPLLDQAYKDNKGCLLYTSPSPRDS